MTLGPINMPRMPRKLLFPLNSLKTINWEYKTCPHSYRSSMSPNGSTVARRISPRSVGNPRIPPHDFTTTPTHTDL